MSTTTPDQQTKKGPIKAKNLVEIDSYSNHITINIEKERTCKIDKVAL